MVQFTIYYYCIGCNTLTTNQKLKKIKRHSLASQYEVKCCSHQFSKDIEWFPRFEICSRSFCSFLCSHRLWISLSLSWISCQLKFRFQRTKNNKKTVEKSYVNVIFIIRFSFSLLDVGKREKKTRKSSHCIFLATKVILLETFKI